MQPWLIAIVVLTLGAPFVTHAQLASHTDPGTQAPDMKPAGPRRIHLILKDGSFQIVRSYTLCQQHTPYETVVMPNQRNNPWQTSSYGDYKN